MKYFKSNHLTCQALPCHVRRTSKYLNLSYLICTRLSEYFLVVSLCFAFLVFSGLVTWSPEKARIVASSHGPHWHGIVSDRQSFGRVPNDYFKLLGKEDIGTPRSNTLWLLKVFAMSNFLPHLSKEIIESLLEVISQNKIHPQLSLIHSVIQ